MAFMPVENTNRPRQSICETELGPIRRLRNARSGALSTCEMGIRH